MSRHSLAGHAMADLIVGLDSWVVQDGNYGDFAQATNASCIATESLLTMLAQARGWED